MAEKFHYGGQAVIEGVMMRGQKAMATAVRRPGGDISVNAQTLAPIYTGWLRKTPLVRGIIVLLESMVLGTKTILDSANTALESEGEKISNWLVLLMILVSLGFSVAVFFIAPLLLASLVDRFVHSSILFHLIEGVIRMGIFVGYLELMNLLPDIRRVFAYHGAEHKTINAYEDGAPLEVASVRNYSTAHLRCGTSFLFTVLVIAILLFSIIGRFESIWLMLLSRIAFIPIIAALSYEVTHFAGNHTRSGLVRATLYPGLLLQKLTTREPDDSQIEVAIAALHEAMAKDVVPEALAAQPS
jgi:uncharacterized protein YqhQ